MSRFSKLLRTALLTGIAALCTTPALADSSIEIPYLATVTAQTAVLTQEPDSGSDRAAVLAAGDSLVLLSLDDGSGWYSAAYQAGEDQVFTGYIPASDVSAQALSRVNVLTEDACLLEETESDAGAITTLGQGASLEVLGYRDGWFYVRAKGETGYVPLSDLDCAVVTESKLKLRAQPNTSSKTLAVLEQGAELVPQGADGDWFQVTVDGQAGYVSSAHVAPAGAEEYTVENPALTTGEQVLAYAQQFLGNRYVWGGTSLTNGCDCSGYVMKIYEQFGVSLPHSSSAIRRYGTKVSYSEIQVGDVVCYSGHVGIYAGDGQIINALNSRSGICYTSVHYSPIVTIRRML